MKKRNLFVTVLLFLSLFVQSQEDEGCNFKKINFPLNDTLLVNFESLFSSAEYEIVTISLFHNNEIIAEKFRSANDLPETIEIKHITSSEPSVEIKLKGKKEYYEQLLKSRLSSYLKEINSFKYKNQLRAEDYIIQITKEGKLFLVENPFREDDITIQFSEYLEGILNKVDIECIHIDYDIWLFFDKNKNSFFLRDITEYSRDYIEYQKRLEAAENGPTELEMEMEKFGVEFTEFLRSYYDFDIISNVQELNIDTDIFNVWIYASEISKNNKIDEVTYEVGKYSGDDVNSEKLKNYLVTLIRDEFKINEHKFKRYGNYNLYIMINNETKDFYVDFSYWQ